MQIHTRLIQSRNNQHHYKEVPYHLASGPYNRKAGEQFFWSPLASA